MQTVWMVLGSQQAALAALFFMAVLLVAVWLVCWFASLETPDHQREQDAHTPLAESPQDQLSS